jgi:hypothetical protein
VQRQFAVLVAIVFLSTVAFGTVAEAKTNRQASERTCAIFESVFSNTAGQGTVPIYSTQLRAFISALNKAARQSNDKRLIATAKAWSVAKKAHNGRDSAAESDLLNRCTELGFGEVHIDTSWCKRSAAAYRDSCTVRSSGS